MEKKKLLEIIRRTARQNGVGSSDDQKRISLREVEVAVSQAYADMLAIMIKYHQSLGFFAKNYSSVAVAYNTTDKVYYSTLPANVVQLPQNAGIYLIRAIGTNKKFYQTSYADVDLYEDLDLYTHYDRNLFLIDGTDKVIYKNYDFASKNVSSVNMKLIIPFEAWDWTDEINIPSGKVTDITNYLAKALYTNKPQLDTSTDGNSV